MSFGYSLGDFILVTQLAYSVVQNTRKACGVHSALAREVNSLHVVLVRLESEVGNERSILNGSSEDGSYEKRQELAGLYNALSVEKRSVQKLWQRVKFGNGEMQDLAKIRSELTTYTQAITLSLNLLGLKSQGKVERYMESHGDELREIKAGLNWVTAKLQVREGSSHGERSILSSYVGDDKEVWKMFRRELIQDGFTSQALKRHKKTIEKYVVELGARGVLDDAGPDEIGEDRAPKPAIQNEAVLNGERVSISAVGLGERAVSNDASQVEEDGEVGSGASAVAISEDSDQFQPNLNPISIPYHPNTKLDPQVERESDFGSDGSEIRDENTPAVELERGVGGLDGSVDCKERLSSDDKRSDTMPNSTSGLASVNMKAQEDFPGPSPFLVPPLFRPNWGATSDQDEDEDESPVPLENGEEKNSKQDELKSKRRSATSTSSPQNQSAKKPRAPDHTPSWYKRPVPGSVHTTPLANGISVTSYERQSSTWGPVQISEYSKD